MLIPYNTDAPIYHWPAGTVGLIAANFLSLVAIGTGWWPHPDDYALWYGRGIHPLQWLTSIFLHAGVLHLVGNMVFLWSFGLVVEGKLGWKKFVPLYLGLGVLQSALEQIALLHHESPDGGFAGSLGASAAIYGLMAVAVVWAPRNDLECLIPAFGLFGAGMIGSFEVPIFVFAGIYIGWDLLMAALDGFLVGAELLHLSGAVLGFLVGTIFVRAGWVECENWDLYSVLTGRHIRLMDEFSDSSADRAPRRRQSEQDSKVDENRNADDGPQQKLLAKIRKQLRARQSFAALQSYDRLTQLSESPDLPEDVLLPLTDAAWRTSHWRLAVPLMEACIALAPQKSKRIRVLLAEILVQHHERPQHALRILEPLQGQTLPPPLEKARLAIAARCQRLIADGVVELQGKAWDSK